MAKQSVEGFNAFNENLELSLGIANLPGGRRLPRASKQFRTRHLKMGEKTWSESVARPWIKNNYGLRFSRAASLSHGAPPVAKGMSVVAQHRVSSKLCQLKQRDGVCHLTKDEIHRIWKQAARIQPAEMAHIDSLSSFMNQCTKHLEMLPGTLQEKALSKASSKKEASHLHGVSRLAETAVAKSLCQRINPEFSQKIWPPEVRQA